jgi:hypothetical protein
MEVRTLKSFLALLKKIYNHGELNTNLLWDDIKEGIEIYDEETRIIEKRINNDPITGDHDLIEISYTQYFTHEFKVILDKIESILDDLDIIATDDFLHLNDFYTRLKIHTDRFLEVPKIDEDVEELSLIDQERVAILRLIIESLENLCDYMKERLESAQILMKPKSILENPSKIDKEKLKLDMTIEEMACFFRLLSEVQIIQDTNKSKIVRVITKSFSSKDQDEYSEDYFKNVFINCIQKGKAGKRIDNVNESLMNPMQVKFGNIIKYIKEIK